MTDDTDRLNEIRERLIPGPQYCISRSFSDIPWLLGKIDRLRTDANLACADLAEANRTIAELREQVKAADALKAKVAVVHAELGLHFDNNLWVKQLWYMLNHALAAFRDAMEEDEATSNSDPTSSRLEDGEAVK